MVTYRMKAVGGSGGGVVVVVVVVVVRMVILSRRKGESEGRWSMFVRRAI